MNTNDMERVLTGSNADTVDTHGQSAKDPQSSALTKLRHSPFLFRATFCPVYCDPIWSVSSNSKFTTWLAQSGGSRSIPHPISNALDSLNRERPQPVPPKTCWLLRVARYGADEPCVARTARSGDVGWHCCIERELAWNRWGSCLGRG